MITHLLATALFAPAIARSIPSQIVDSDKTVTATTIDTEAPATTSGSSDLETDDITLEYGGSWGCCFPEDNCCPRRRCKSNGNGNGNGAPGSGSNDCACEAI